MKKQRGRSSFIRKCIEAYLSTFPVDWIESYDWSDKKKFDEYHKDGVKKITNFIESFFIFFCRSIISGEYIIKKQIDKELEEICDIVSNEYQPNDPILLKQQLYNEYQRLDENLYLLATKYRFFITIIKNKINPIHRQYIVNAIYTNGRKISIQQFDVLNFAFKIFMLDHSLSYDKNDISELILISEDLNKQESLQNDKIKPIYRILREKCFFLIKKLIYFSNGTTEYLINLVPKEINISREQSEAFNEFDKSFNFFHKKDYQDYSHLVLDWQQKCFNKNIKIGQMILLMKFYKDCKTTTIQQVNNLIKDFDILYNILSNKFSDRQFDLYALNTQKNYMYNSRLSFRMKHDYSFSKLCIDIDEINDIQANTHIKNFYPYQKAILYTIKDIRHDIEGKKYVEDDIKKKISFLEAMILKFEDSILWCEEVKFYPVQNLYNECIKSDSSYGGVVFTPSSYSRPIKYDKLHDDLQGFKSELRSLKNEILLSQEKLSIEHLKKEINESKKGYIEILGVFTAVMTFLFGTINIFSNENSAEITIYDRILNIVCLGIILLLFVSSIYFFTIKEKTLAEWYKHPIFYVFGFSVIIYIISLIIILSYTKTF